MVVRRATRLRLGVPLVPAALVLARGAEQDVSHGSAAAPAITPAKWRRDNGGMGRAGMGGNYRRARGLPMGKGF